MKQYLSSTSASIRSTVTTFSLNDLLTLMQGKNKEVSLSKTDVGGSGPDTYLTLVPPLDNSIFDENLCFVPVSFRYA